MKISGRGLGHTGGTIDKLEAIPGLRTDLEPDALRTQARAVGCVIAAQTADLVPADGAVYALRDATATVRSIPLIAASVMAKKLAIGSDLILLDVKAGSGAFMRDPREAAELVDACLAIAREAGRDAAAAITDMSQPLGTTVGNALEVAEAIEVLRGQRAGLLRDLSVWLAARALARLTGTDVGSATERASARLSDGSALESFGAMIGAQHGAVAVIDDPWAVLPAAPVQVPISGDRTGFVTGVDAAAIGEVAARLGAGRRHKHEPIDPAVGIVLTPKVGDRIEDGQPIGVVHARDEQQGRAAAIAIGATLTIGEEPGERPPHGACVERGGGLSWDGRRCDTPPTSALSLLIGMIVREYVRALVTAKLGDPTPRLWGRLTWNPKVWFDPFGSGLVPGLVLVLWAAASGFYPPPAAYGKPAPVDPTYLRRPTRDQVLIGFAGPLANVALAAVAGIVLRLTIDLHRHGGVPDPRGLRIHAVVARDLPPAADPGARWRATRCPGASRRGRAGLPERRSVPAPVRARAAVPAGRGDEGARLRARRFAVQVVLRVRLRPLVPGCGAPPALSSRPS